MIQIENISKVFRTTEVETVALNHVNLEVKEGEFVAIMGPSGCGKSTLLNILGLLDNPTEGSYLLMGEEVAGLKEKERTRVRKGKLGFVFQSFNLIDELNVYENVELPLTYLGLKSSERRRMVEDILKRMNINHRAKHFPQQLSGGQQQRVAIARAVVTNPQLILADEPTGVKPDHLLSGQLTPSELRQIHEASTELSHLPIHIDDNPSVSMDYIRSSAKLLQSKGKCDGVIIDYLQLCDMKTDQHNRNREQEVAQASRKAKMMAKELHIPVILLSQLNRNVEGHPDNRPSLSDLRESGAIEQDADLVLMLSRPALSGRATDRKSTYSTDGLGVIGIVKHRNGMTGELYFRHDPSMTKLEDYVPGIDWMKKNTTA